MLRIKQQLGQLFICLGWSLLFNMTLFAQVIQQWEAHFSQPNATGDFTRSMCIDNIGNVYITGQSNDTNSSSHFSTVKYSTTGVLQWSAVFGGYPHIGASASSIAVDRIGNSYVTGISPLSNIGPSKTTTIKYNQFGAQCWVSIFYGQYYNGSNFGDDITVDSSSNVYVASDSWSINNGYDYATIKYDSSGIQQWISYYHGDVTGQDFPRCIKVDNACNVYVTGSSWGGIANNYDIATVKYNSSGGEMWSARYNGTGSFGDTAMALAIDNSGNVYIAGRSWGGDSSGYDYITIKYNSLGIKQWEARYTSLGNRLDYPNSIAVDSQGNVYVTGYTMTSIIGLDCGTVKYSSSGVQQWVTFYDYDGGPDWGVSVALDNSGCIYVTAASAEGIRIHYATIKYSTSGIKLWSVRTYSQNGETPVENAVDSLGNVYVAGSDGHFLTIKYNQLTGISPVSNTMPGEYKLYQNYPNPFNPVTELKFELFKKGCVSLKVFDINGKMVQTYFDNKQLNEGTYKVKFDGTNLASGIYFYSLFIDNNRIDTRKMVLFK